MSKPRLGSSSPSVFAIPDPNAESSWTIITVFAGLPAASLSRIRFSATARKQLLSGDIDPRLPMLIAAMAHGHPVRVVDFGGWSPGGGPASLLRWVDLATVNGRAHLTRAAYVRWMRSFIDVQRAQYRPARSEQVTLPTGQAVLRIEYLAPSPLSQP